MAVELGQFLSDQLARLPEDHPDRSFLEGMAQSVAAFVERTDPAFSVDLWQGRRQTEPIRQLPLTTPPAETAAASPDGDPTERSERERVTLRGRMGKRVRYSTTPKGIRRAEFNLAVDAGDERTTWHTVLAFRERADKLEAADPKPGQYTEVIGYRHTEERRTRDGKAKTLERIIAAHVRLH